jgi:GrpB-like predicted nucleotidyltransferase (UPF0157 family)
LSNTKIVIAEHDPGWPYAFAREAQRIRPAFGALLVELHHIGSTAVPGLRAKPVIDILAVVTDVDALDSQSHEFEALGYEVMGEFGLPGRRYFRRDDPRGVRTHQVHAYARESAGEIERHLDFRDYMREHPETARAYAELKQSLADECDGDMGCYSDGKTAFIREVEQRAALWKRDSSSDHRPRDDRWT